jgi:glycosyltransferase involved in cell wall biosynthesis
MGVPAQHIFLTPYAVDNIRFMDAAALCPDARAEVRRGFGVHDETPIILFAAKFDERKCPGDLLQAAALLERDGAKFQLVMVGSGSLDAPLREMARGLGLRNIHFHGFANQSALPAIYGASEIFVLPSKNEPWGLAINEAMCAGLPIVASSEIGCVPDLVHDGVNGRTFPAGDIAALANALRGLVANREVRVEMGRASRAIISRWSFAEVGDGVRSALQSAGISVSPPTRRAA